MSFNQYRTNPGQAVSNFKGRTDTPKAWPSTRVSQWLNGGLFGGSGAETWLSIYSFINQASISSGASGPYPAKPWLQQTTSALTSDGSVVMKANTGNSYYNYYQIAPNGVVTENGAQIGNYSMSQGQFHTYGFTTDGSDLLLNPGTTTINNNPNQRLTGLVVSPLSNTNSAGTPTIEDFEAYDFNGGAWNGDQVRSIQVYKDTTASDNLLHFMWCCEPQGRTGWASGTYNVSTNDIACTGFAYMYGSDWASNGETTNWTVMGDSGQIYAFVKGNNGSANTYMSYTANSAQSYYPHRIRNQAWRKSFTYTSGGECQAAYSVGQYNGQDQIFVMIKAQQLYGGFETLIYKMTPYNGQVQQSKMIYAAQNQGSMTPTAAYGGNGAVIDSAGNIYLVMDRSGVVNKEIVVMKLDSSFVVQWTRCLQLNKSNTWNQNLGGNAYSMEATGINLSVDENYVTLHANLEYVPDNGQNTKALAFRVKTDGSGAMPNSGDAVKLDPAVRFTDPTVRNDFANALGNLFVRYYDPADTSASPNPRAVNVTSFGNNWGSATSNGNSNYFGAQTSKTVPTMTVANVPLAYGNYAYEDVFPG